MKITYANEGEEITFPSISALELYVTEESAQKEGDVLDKSKRHKDYFFVGRHLEVKLSEDKEMSYTNIDELTASLPRELDEIQIYRGEEILGENEDDCYKRVPLTDEEVERLNALSQERSDLQLRLL